MNDLATTTFNYTDLPADLAISLRRQAERIRERAKKTTKAIIEIGCDLLAVKQNLPHGMFGSWDGIRSEGRRRGSERAQCSFLERLAQRSPSPVTNGDATPA